MPLTSLADRIVRYSELRPCTTAFIDTRTPGSDRKENFTIIGPGVSESPDQHVHIDLPHGFNLGAARQPPGCVNSQHSHDTAEVFIVHSGHWSFHVGELGDEASVRLAPGDTISIPTQVFRGFTNVGEDAGFMFAVLGEDNPGRVTWAPSVFKAAEDHGLLLLENGQLIDRAKGEAPPPGVQTMQVTSRAAVESMRRLDETALSKCVVRYRAFADGAPGELQEHPIIGGLPLAGPLSWPHGFSLRYLRIESGAGTRQARRNEEQVVIVHRGELGIEMDDGTAALSAGDIASIPVDLPRRLFNPGARPTEAFLVYRGDNAPLLEPKTHD